MINQRYKIIKLLGKGRSSVYLCEDIDVPGDYFAIKIMPDNAGDIENELFSNEFFTLCKLNHPNIVKAYDLGTIVQADKTDYGILTGSKYFTLEYIKGKSLPDFDNVIDENILTEVIKQLCLVLSYLHLSNYIYYDLKPENILITFTDGQPVVKLIDLGFAQCIIENKESVIRGTAEYIAPEILKNELHDYKADFYSLGMVIYKLIFKKFPFETDNEVDVYKAQIEQEFEFPETDISDNILNVVKKLLKKNPGERYSNAAEILKDLNIDFTREYAKELMPAKVFAGRKDYLTILKTYISDKESREVFTVRGSEGAGKTSLAYKLYASIDNSIFIDNNNSLSGFEFFRLFLKKILFNSFVSQNLSKELIRQIELFNTDNSLNLAEEIKSIINKLSSECTFVLILDSFNSYDDFTLEIFRNIIPILQVNSIKVILTENSDRHNASEFILNLREINLTPFTEVQLSEYLDKSFAPFFPKEQLKKLILSYADLLPGSLEGFIKDLLILNVIKFTPRGVEVSADDTAALILKSSHEDIYNIRFKNLNDAEISAAAFLSAFEILPGINIICRYFNYDEKSAVNILNSLYSKNIIHNIISGTMPSFTSEGLKKHIYLNIPDKKKQHYNIAVFLSGHFRDYNKTELARQYELAESYEESYNILKEELISAGEISAYSFQRNILQRLLSYPLNKRISAYVNIEYCRVLTNLNDYRTALDHINKIIDTFKSSEQSELLILKSRCLTGLGELDEGKSLLESLIAKVDDPPTGNKLLIDLANVNFNLNKYDETFEICSKLTGRKGIDYDTLGSAYQLLGLISLYKDNDLDSALRHFGKTNFAYQKGGLKLRQAGILMNIGNIHSMRGEDEMALDNWNKSLSLNQSIGNIQQEAKLLINFGIYYFNTQELDRSTENYSKAFTIFNSLGIKDGQGLVETNLGEIFLLTCDYQKAYDSLIESIEIFRHIQNKEEELQSMFLLGKLYYTMGDYEKLKQLLEEFQLKLNDEISEVNKSNYEYLSALSKISGNNLNDVLLSLTELRTQISVEDRKYDYFQCSAAMISLMLKLNILDEAAVELRSEEMIKLCSGNNFFEAERNYLLGLISEKNPLLGLTTPGEYFLTAHELIYDNHISELTWKILYALFRLFNVRGNTKKSREYEKYCKSLIKYISDNIKDVRLRKTYLEQSERKEALKELNYYEEQF